MVLDPKSFEYEDRLVHRGEDISIIARRLAPKIGVTTGQAKDLIIGANGLQKPYTIHLGETIRVPTSRVPPENG
jgi:hypothetical protein